VFGGRMQNEVLYSMPVIVAADVLGKDMHCLS
jgi:hypothetical protein